ncbi:MAG TPA: hypothetical protein VHG28_10735 [Longimicrobiaceae bacterium]|nr:hypothetical protein [Longimicrobiaceae bacterium]
MSRIMLIVVLLASGVGFGGPGPQPHGAVSGGSATGGSPPAQATYVIVADIENLQDVFEREDADSSLVDVLRGRAAGVFAVRAAASRDAARDVCESAPGDCDVIVLTERKSADKRQIDLYVTLRSVVKKRGERHRPVNIPNPPPETCGKDPRHPRNWVRCRDTYFADYTADVVRHHNAIHLRN